MTAKLNQQWRLAARPEGDLKDGDLTWQEEPVPELNDGQFLVRSIYLSIDPTNRMWMSDAKGYLPPVAIGDVMRGGAIGVVEESRHDGFKAGDKVSGMLGWQRYAVSDGNGVSKLPEGMPVPLEAFMAVLNHIGATAYFGLLDIGQPKAGETVVVSTAAGAVGSLVGQIAKIKGCRAIGLTSTDEKCAWVKELGYDGVINYKTEDIPKRLKELCPDGIDVYFDNVGGKILDAALAQLNLRARVPTCGLIS
ncbi:MAG: NADP-dependent oxidoreductase, partial [Myxococcota bacterium]